MPHTAYLSLGSNIGDRKAHLLAAWRMLSFHCSSRRLSQIYETVPMYLEDQPMFLNAVGEVVLSCEPRELLGLIHDIEGRLGRDREKERRMGPRPIDVDILLFDALVIDSPELTIPHPRLAERSFVLVPLLELCPELRDPRTGAPYMQSLRALNGETRGIRGVYSPPAE